MLSTLLIKYIFHWVMVKIGRWWGVEPICLFCVKHFTFSRPGAPKNMSLIMSIPFFTMFFFGMLCVIVVFVLFVCCWWCYCFVCVLLLLFWVGDVELYPFQVCTGGVLTVNSQGLWWKSCSKFSTALYTCNYIFIGALKS